MKNTKISVKNLNLYYGENHALKDVSMEIKEKAITAFIGPSGCGKSTFLKTINRMNDLVDSVKITGTVEIDGEDIYCYEPIEISIPQGESKELGIVCNVVAKSIVPDIVTLTSNLPDASFVVMLEEPWSVNDNTASVSLFPNPANESVTLKGENLSMVHVYNSLGQKVDEFEANGSELCINTTGYENGVYVVKAGEKTLRFVVKH